MSSVSLWFSPLAHPVPNENHDRTIVVRLTPDAVVVDYRLEVDEGRAARDLPRAETGRRHQSEASSTTAFTPLLRPVLAGNLDARLDGKPLDVHLRPAAMFEVHRPPALRLPLRGALAAGRRRAASRFTFREGNYETGRLQRPVG